MARYGHPFYNLIVTPHQVGAAQRVESDQMRAARADFQRDAAHRVDFPQSPTQLFIASSGACGSLGRSDTREAVVLQ